MGLAGFSLAILGATTAFAQSALPGETLYSWKLSTERAWRATSSDPLATDFSLADRRADELVSLAKRGNHNERSEEAESLGISEYNLVLDRLSQEAGERQQSEELQIALKKHQKRLAEAGVHVPRLDDAVEHGNGNGGGNGRP
jgi:hypothetical protein